MDLSRFERKKLEKCRITPVKCQNSFSRVKKTHDYLSEIDVVYSKRIMDLVEKNPTLGSIRLSDALVHEGISIEPIYIYRILVKYNLNRKSLRMAWKDSLEKIRKGTEV